MDEKDIDIIKSLFHEYLETQVDYEFILSPKIHRFHLPSNIINLSCQEKAYFEEALNKYLHQRSPLSSHQYQFHWDLEDGYSDYYVNGANIPNICLDIYPVLDLAHTQQNYEDLLTAQFDHLSMI